jgi:DNA-directed RNA polymerase subunit RPC12/RpoP
MPDDLLVPTFQCAYCHEQLSTAAYAGRDVVSAEEMRVHLAGLMTNPRAAGPAPRVAFTNTRTHPATCVHCHAALLVPLDMRAKTVECPGCRRVEPVTRYVSDAQRMMLDMQRQIAANQELARLRTDGVPCSRCGAKNPVTEEAAVQIICRFCGAPVLLSDHVDTSAVARSRMKLGLNQMRERMADDERKQRRNAVIIVVLVLSGISLAFLLTFVFHLLPG